MNSWMRLIELLRKLRMDKELSRGNFAAPDATRVFPIFSILSLEWGIAPAEFYVGN